MCGPYAVWNFLPPEQWHSQNDRFLALRTPKNPTVGAMLCIQSIDPFGGVPPPPGFALTEQGTTQGWQKEA